MRNTVDSYGSVSKFLHWLIALLVLVMLIVGVSFNYLPDGPFQSFLLQVHKSTGVTILGIMVIRLFWRWINPYPRFPATMKLWEKITARVVHFLFYLLLIAMPITGIVMTLAGNHPLSFWWLGNIHLNFIPRYKPLSHLMAEWHEYLAWTIAVFFVFHTAAALKHHFIDKDNVMIRMWRK